ncbi:MAG: hypothetical protein KDD96_09275, partial [Rhodobacteraceae bacterium]|nr:hypothetical protein [Paracoccaceae bacterium]
AWHRSPGLSDAVADLDTAARHGMPGKVPGHPDRHDQETGIVFAATVQYRLAQQEKFDQTGEGKDLQTEDET